MKQCFFILGMHRSGTSALGGVLNLMGLEFGSDLMAANEGNPKGYFENNYVYNLNKKILFEQESSWCDYSFDARKISKNKKTLYVNEAKKIIDNEFKYAEKFVIKDPRICLLFPVWEQACKELNIDIKIIIPFRNPIEVANSLKQRNNFSLEKSLILWTHHVLSAEYYSRKYDVLVLTFNKLVNEIDSSIKKLSEFVEINTDKQAITNINKFLDKKIKHNNISIKNFTRETPPFLRKIISFVAKEDFSNKKEFDELRKDFYYSLDFFFNKEIKEDIKQLAEFKNKNQILENDKKLLIHKIKKFIIDEAFYLNKYEDVKNTGLNPGEHFFSFGYKEDRIPNNYKKEIEAAFAKINELEKNIIDNNNQLNIKDNNINELISLKDNQIKEIEAKNVIIDKNKDIIESLTKNKNELLSLNNEFVNLREEQIKEIESKNIIITEHKDRITNLIENKENLISLNKELVTKNENQINKINNQSIIISKLENKLEQIIDNKDELIKFNKELIAIKENQKEEIFSLKSKINKLKDDAKQIIENKNELIKLNKVLITNKEKQTEKINNLKNNIIKLETEIRYINKETIRQEKLYEKQITAKDKQIEKINIKQKEFAVLKEKLDYIENRNIEQIRINEERIAIKDKEITELIFEKNKVVDLLKKELEETNNDNKTIVNKLNNIILGKEEAINSLENSKNIIIEDLNKQIVIIKNDLKEKRKNIEQTNLKLSDISSKLLLIEKEKKDLTNKYIMLANKETELLNIIKEKEEKINSLNKHLQNERNKKNELEKSINEILSDLVTIKESRTWKIASSLKTIKKIIK